MINLDWVYIICSEKFEPERYENWSKWLKDNDIKGSIEFYKWGSELSEDEINQYVLRDGTLETLYPWRTGYPIRSGEASIAINFIKIFQDAYEKNYDKILILESDVILHPSFIFAINEIVKTVGEVDFNSISIGCGMGMRVQSQNPQAILAQVDQFRCADSLIFNRTSINHFYNNLKQIRLPIDEEFTNAAKSGQIKVFWLEPPIAVQGSQVVGNESSVQYGNPYNLQIPWAQVSV